MYVVNQLSDTVSFININTTSSTVVGSSIAVGDGPHGIAYDPVNKRMYVTNNFDNSVSVIDTTNNKVVGGPITVGSRPTEIAYDPVNKRMYVANASVNNISVIDTTKNTVVSIPVLVGAVLPH